MKVRRSCYRDTKSSGRYCELHMGRLSVDLSQDFVYTGDNASDGYWKPTTLSWPCYMRDLFPIDAERNAWLLKHAAAMARRWDKERCPKKKRAKK